MAHPAVTLTAFGTVKPRCYGLRHKRCAGMNHARVLAYCHAQDVFQQAMRNSESRMYESPREPNERTHELLSQRFNGRLRVIARQSVTYWYNREKLDKLLAQYVGSLEGCELLYAIDQSGRQVSSNIFSTSIDTSAFGQDLSQRPYAVSLSVLQNVAFHGAFACDAYVSQATERPCVTVMYGVTSGGSLMGFIAADFYPAEE